MDWRVRAATIADAPSLALIGSATFLETFAGLLDGGAIVAHCRREHSASAYQQYLCDGAFAWLAETQRGGAPIGFALLAGTDLPGSEPGGADLELKRIYTLSRFHGSGMGSRLMHCAAELARDKGARRLLLGVYAGNERAIAFYGKNGFKRIADRRFRVGDREYPDIVFALAL
ncbi:MAG TPA: GNAT family N-acetyltransferase [Allosphingosinicella sp.]|jgi:ribosomal protein S18 acetylase RimI-like enzyme